MLTRALPLTVPFALTLPLIVALTLASAHAAHPVSAQSAPNRLGRVAPEPQGTTLQTSITERYRASGVRRWMLGDGYRDVWETPIQIGVLDLRTAARGLDPVEIGGYGQTLSLEFLGGDGLEYAVRSVDKDPTRRLDPRYLGTVVEDVVQDQVAQLLPTAGLVVDPLLDATGILHPRHQLVVIPNASRLGDFREDFAGMIGMFTDRPEEGAGDTPGFAGSTRIVGTDKMLDLIEQGGCDRVDDRGYLKARLVDLIIGDRDRHEGQWRWARFPDADGCSVWRTIPEDRDQAFVRNDGLMLRLYRMLRPQYVPFGPEYPDMAGLTFNGWEVDRDILSELDEHVWVEVAEQVRSELTDEVIGDAVSRLPDAHEALVGDFLAGSLASRRDGIVEQARAYYAILAREPDVKATDRDEHATIEHLPDGDLRVSIRYRTDASGQAANSGHRSRSAHPTPSEHPANSGHRANSASSERPTNSTHPANSAHPTLSKHPTTAPRPTPSTHPPHFERTFRADVTDEVRIYLRGGDDLVTVTGGPGRIVVRAIGGGGDDRFVNASTAGTDHTRFYDDRGDNRVEGAARLDDRPYERPDATNQAHRHALDWGDTSRYLPFFSYDRELGLTLGISFHRRRYGFRTDPSRAEHTVRAALVTGGPAALVGWDSRFRGLSLGADLVVGARYSGLEVLRFYGYGAGTTEGPDPEHYEVVQRELTLSAGLEWAWGDARSAGRGKGEDPNLEAGDQEARPMLRLGFAPVLKHSDTPVDENAGRYIASQAPRGFGRFAQAGGRAWMEIDTRDNPAYPTSGLRLEARGEAYPALLDADDPFGRIEGRLSGYLTPDVGAHAPTLAMRIGAAHAFGAFPFHEAAFLGGHRDLRGAREQRFAGDAALFANAELRIPVWSFDLLFPTELGLHGAVDAGRVFHGDDPPSVDPWDRSYGGGLWLSFLDRDQTLGITLVQGRDRLGLYVGGGFHF